MSSCKDLHPARQRSFPNAPQKINGFKAPYLRIACRSTPDHRNQVLKLSGEPVTAATPVHAPASGESLLTSTTPECQAYDQPSQFEDEFR